MEGDLAVNWWLNLLSLSFICLAVFALRCIELKLIGTGNARECLAGLVQHSPIFRYEGRRTIASARGVWLSKIAPQLVSTSTLRSGRSPGSIMKKCGKSALEVSKVPQLG